MDKRKVVIKKVNNVESLGQITDEELSKLSEEYEPDNYNPLNNMENKGETITIRLTKSEKDKLAAYAKSKGIKKSNFIRAIILKSLDDSDGIIQENMQEEIHEIYSMIKKNIEINNEIKKIIIQKNSVAG